MAKNADYFHSIRAQGVCTLCRLPMPDDDPKLAHADCYKLQWRKTRAADIRRIMRDRERARVALLPQRHAHVSAHHP